MPDKVQARLEESDILFIKAIKVVYKVLYKEGGDSVGEDDLPISCCRLSPSGLF